MPVQLAAQLSAPHCIRRGNAPIPAAPVGVANDVAARRDVELARGAAADDVVAAEAELHAASEEPALPCAGLPVQIVAVAELVAFDDTVAAGRACARVEQTVRRAPELATVEAGGLAVARTERERRYDEARCSTLHGTCGSRC